MPFLPKVKDKSVTRCPKCPQPISNIPTQKKTMMHMDNKEISLMFAKFRYEIWKAIRNLYH